MQSSKLKTKTQNQKTDLKLRSYTFPLHLIEFIETLPNKKIYWIIGDQLLRSGTSIGANIVEAKVASSKRDFIKFYTIALKSANETIELANILGASILTMKNKRTF